MNLIGIFIEEGLTYFFVDIITFGNNFNVDIFIEFPYYSPYFNKVFQIRKFANKLQIVTMYFVVVCNKIFQIL
jgi:hypothetical protein